MSLKDRILAQIVTNGPLRLSDYMAQALSDPEEGYYTTRDPLGTAGDFITAPEISQMFGELVGLALAQSWLDQDKPAPFTLAELGPGRGTLTADLLRATAHVPGFHDAAQIHLVETSPVLRDLQAHALAGHAPAWHDDVRSLPKAPLFLVANEFFDALPINQFVRDGTGWRERHVGLRDDDLSFGLGPRQAQPALAHRLDDTRDNDIVEDCPAAGPIVAEITGRIAQHGGAALVIDYGDWRSLGDTLQAVAGHASVDPLAAPGAADLTAHVDFEALSQAALCAHTKLTPQGVFLERLGITARARALASQAELAQADAIVAAHRRLTHPEEMGNLFKVLGFFPASGPPPAGLTI